MPDAPHIAPDDDEGASSSAESDAAEIGGATHRALLLSRIWSRRFVLTGGAAALVVIVLLALLFTMFPPLRGGKASTAPTSTIIAQETSGLTYDASPTSTAGQSTATTAPTATVGAGSAGSGTGGTGGTGDAGAPPSSTGQNMRVTGLSLAVDRTSFDGPCTEGVPFTFTLTVSVAPHAQGGTVSYQWLSSNVAGILDEESLAFGPGEITRSATYRMLVPWQFGDGSQRWMAAQATAPNTLTSAHQNYSFTCQRMIMGITGSATPSTWTGACGADLHLDFAFDAALSYGPGQYLTWSINGSNGYTSSDGAWHPSSGKTFLPDSFGGPVHVSYGTVSYDFSYDVLPATAPNGDYRFQLTLAGPNNSMSKTLHVTKNCQ